MSFLLKKIKEKNFFAKVIYDLSAITIKFQIDKLTVGKSSIQSEKSRFLFLFYILAPFKISSLDNLSKFMITDNKP